MLFFQTLYITQDIIACFIEEKTEDQRGSFAQDHTVSGSTAGFQPGSPGAQLNPLSPPRAPPSWQAVRVLTVEN